MLSYKPSRINCIDTCGVYEPMGEAVLDIATAFASSHIRGEAPVVMFTTEPGKLSVLAVSLCAAATESDMAYRLV